VGGIVCCETRVEPKVRPEAIMTLDAIRQKLKEISNLPDSAVVEIPVAAQHDGVSVRTVRRSYPLVELSERRKGVRVGFLRHRQVETAA
jgi:hypothetical protein